MNSPLVTHCESDLFYSKAGDYIKKVNSVLDVGCGIRPQQFITPEFLVCVEPYQEYVEILKENLVGSNTVILPLEAKQALSALPDKAIDSIFLIDVIEHMPKDIGFDVIRECERVAREQIILFTPLGYMPQEVHAGDSDGWNLSGGDLQEHKSGWYIEDFPGWNILVCNHLHTIDHKGQPIEPPYGGFYAIKNIEKKENYFNYLYSKDMIQNSSDSLEMIHNNFPDFVEQVVHRDIEKSNLKCGVESCHRMTSLLVTNGKDNSVDEIFESMQSDRDKYYMQEAKLHIDRIRKFSEEFHNINQTAKSNELMREDLEKREELFSKTIFQRDEELRLREVALKEQESIALMREDLEKREEIFKKLITKREEEFQQRESILTSNEHNFSSKLSVRAIRGLLRFVRFLK